MNYLVGGGRSDDSLRLAMRNLASHNRNQFAAIIDRIFERIEAANQKRGDAEVIVGQHGFRHLLGRSDQRGRVAARAGRRRHRRP